LSPLFVSNWRKHRFEYSWRHVRRAMPPALMLGLHFITWTQGAQWTHVTNASLIVNMVPVVMPFILFFTAREIVTKTEIGGTLIAFCGVLLLTASDFLLSRESLRGDILCFVSMILYAFYLAQGRANRDFPNIWLYLVPLYAMAGTFCLLVSMFVARPFMVQPPREYLLALGLAVVPTVLGHSILNFSMRHLRGQIVSVFNLCQFVFVGLLAYLLRDEIPLPVFYPAGFLVVAGALIVVRASTPTKRSQDEFAETEIAESSTRSVI